MKSLDAEKHCHIARSGRWGLCPFFLLLSRCGENARLASVCCTWLLMECRSPLCNGQNVSKRQSATPLDSAKLQKKLVYGWIFLFFYVRETAFTPFTPLSFLINALSACVSPTIMVSAPEKSPSFESMLMLRSMIFSSLEMMDVMLLTMPKSSLPTTWSVMGYLLSPFPAHFAGTMR